MLCSVLFKGCVVNAISSPTLNCDILLRILFSVNGQRFQIQTPPQCCLVQTYTLGSIPVVSPDWTFSVYPYKTALSYCFNVWGYIFGQGCASVYLKEKSMLSTTGSTENLPPKW